MTIHFQAQFRTVKYHPEYPAFFESLEDSKMKTDKILCWYNHEHHHTGLNLHTPADVFFGRAKEVTKQRQDVMNLAYEKRPERFSNGKPVTKLNPSVVGINLRYKILPEGGSHGLICIPQNKVGD